MSLFQAQSDTRGWPPAHSNTPKAMKGRKGGLYPTIGQGTAQAEIIINIKFTLKNVGSQRYALLYSEDVRLQI